MAKLSYFILPLGILCSGVSIAPQPEPQPVVETTQQSEVRDFKFVSTHMTSGEDIPREFYFAGQWVPAQETHVHTKLVKTIRKYSKYNYGNKIITRRLGRYEQTFRNILSEMGVPEDFVYLSVIESNLSNAISPVGARGFWQFMPYTAKQYGLEVSSTVDERYHPEKATYAAAEYLLAAYEEFEDWFLVAAAYNMGPGGVHRAMRHQEACSYFDLDLNRETAKYVYRMLAHKIILNQPQKYEIEVSEDRMLAPIEYSSVMVDKNISNLATFAREHGTDLETLRNLNPWLIANRLKVKAGKTYEIRIPLDENLRMDELAVENFVIDLPEPQEESQSDSTQKVESIVQDKETPATPVVVADSSKKV
ncbi:MAG: lytic transglycosylase domain-containing protein [Bacteroidota bacterium]